jgi:hypothetical protein
MAFVLAATMTGAAHAQFPMPGFKLDGAPKRKLTPEEQEQQQKLDDAYKSATTKIPDKKSNDPWATVRPSPSASQSKSKQQ